MANRINLKLMEKFFVERLGFQSVKGENLYGGENIEEELYLRIPGEGYISIVKYFDDDEYDINMQGRSHGPIEQASKYVMYFMDRERFKETADAAAEKFLSMMDEEVKRLEE